ncbi:MAG: diguanylate cyclase [bacterium]
MEEKNILIIDNDANIHNILKEILQPMGYVITDVYSMQDLKQIIQSNLIELSIIFIDLTLTGRLSLEIIKTIKDIYKQAYLITLTEEQYLSISQNALNKGLIVESINKPFNTEEAQIVIQRVLEKRFLLKQASEKAVYHELAIIDALTRVYNRRYLDEILTREVERARRYSFTISLVMIDIDNFKKYNDTKGHQAGDTILQQVGQFFQKHLRNSDMIFRYGGEEFTLYLPHTTKDDAMLVAERLLVEERKAMEITLSLGLAAFPEDAMTLEELIHKADSALYRAKTTGKNKVCMWNKEYEKKLDKISKTLYVDLEKLDE